MRGGYDVIKSELFACELFAAVLAGIIIADINVLSAESDSMAAPRFHIRFQSKYTGELKSPLY
jgi:hypothetical protein